MDFEYPTRKNKSVPKISNEIINQIHERNSLSYDEILKLLNDIFLVNYYERKIGYAELIGTEEIDTWIKYFIHRDCSNMKQIMRDGPSRHDRDQTVGAYISKIYPVINHILSIGDEKISLCGGSVVDIMRGCTPKDWDFFFHNTTIEEADKILHDCLCYIKSVDDKIMNIKYTISQAVLTVEFHSENGFDKLYKIQFIKRIYENKEHVLLGFDFAPCRMGYNINDGFFATYDAGITFALGAFPIETKCISLYHKNRITKYLGKGFYVLLPGLSKDLSGKSLPTPIGTIEKYNSINIREVLTGTITNEFFKFKDEAYSSDYLYQASQGNNIFAINKEIYHSVSFSVFDQDDINRFSDYIISTCVNNKDSVFNRIPDSIKDFENRHIKDFLGDKAEEFIISFYVNDDKEKCKNIWKERQKWYLDKARYCADLCKNSHWHIENIKDPMFGRFAPSFGDPREWYGKENYRPFVVGISNERLQALMDCCKNIDYMNIPKEIFRTICDYWLEGEVSDARKRLDAMIDESG